jgi:hypothetical protein
MIAGPRQRSDANCITAKHFGGNFCRIIARTKNDEVCIREPAHETLKIAVGRDQDEVTRRSVFKNPEIAGTCKPVSKGTL